MAPRGSSIAMAKTEGVAPPRSQSHVISSVMLAPLCCVQREGVLSFV
jgi:hypothetical protein